MKNMSIQTTNFGYILSNDTEKFVFNRTKKQNSKTDYYLKQVKPNECYLSGMFYDKRKNVYTGRTIDKRKITLKIENEFCTLEIQ